MWIDAVLILTLVLGFYKGYETGLLRTLLVLLTIVMSFLLALKFSFIVYDVLQQWLPQWTPKTRMILSFFLVFAVGYIVFRWIAESLYRWIGHTPLSIPNKIFGGALYAYIYLLVVSGMLWLLLDYRLLHQQWVEHSQLYPVADAHRTAFIEQVQNLQPYFEEFFHRVQSELPLHPPEKESQ